MSAWKVRMRTIAADPSGTALPGQEIEVPEVEGRALVPRYADLVSIDESPASTTVEPEPEPDEIIPEPAQAETGSQRKEYKCPACDAVFTNPKSLSAHKKTHVTG